MKTIKIFLASSILEFSEYRLKLVEFISDLENILDEYDIFIDLFVCEDYDASVAHGRTQEKYNDFIRQPCDIFFNLYGKKAGTYTLEELKVAIDCYNKYAVPKIYINLDNDNLDNENLKNLHEIITQTDFIETFEFNSLVKLKLQALNSIKKAEPKIKITLEKDELKVFDLRLMYVKNDDDKQFVLENLM